MLAHDIVERGRIGDAELAARQHLGVGLVANLESIAPSCSIAGMRIEQRRDDELDLFGNLCPPGIESREEVRAHDRDGDYPRFAVVTENGGIDEFGQDEAVEPTQFLHLLEVLAARAEDG